MSQRDNALRKEGSSLPVVAHSLLMLFLVWLRALHLCLRRLSIFFSLERVPVNPFLQFRVMVQLSVLVAGPCRKVKLSFSSNWTYILSTPLRICVVWDRLVQRLSVVRRLILRLLRYAEHVINLIKRA